jgi:AraC-like DNA-binding protein
VRRFLTRIAAPVDRILERVHLPPDVFSHPETLIPLAVAMGFLREAARSQSIDLLGALIGQDTSLEMLGMFGRRIAQAATLEDALTTATCTVASYDSGEVFWFDRTSDEPRFCHRFTRRFDEWQQQAEQYSVMSALRLLKSVAGPSWQPHTVHVKNGVPRAIANMELLRGSTVVADDVGWAISVPQSILRLPMPRPSEPTDTPSDWRRWEASAPSTDFPGAVGQLLGTLLRAGEADVRIVARWIGTSVRTLQRRLEDEGATYAHVLAKTRLDTALRLLRDQRMRLGDIAVALGYSDPAHFTRAFRRWTGNTPRTFRQLGSTAAGTRLVRDASPLAPIPTG